MVAIDKGAGSYRILVVDDDFILNELFCSFLSSKGFDTIAADGIQQAEKMLREQSDIDLLLLDYQLEDGVGTELLDVSKTRNFRSNPPVIMISVNEDPEFLEACFELGVDDYIIKPVNLSLLALKVRALINSVKLQRLISRQNSELEIFKSNAEREESIAKFTYDYLLRHNSQSISGINILLRSCSSFSGDIALAKVSPSGDIYFLLADATGHGLSAAITIMPMVSVFNSMVEKGFHLQQLVAELNRKLVNDTPTDRFVAALVIEIGVTKKVVSVWNGAMPPVYWILNKRIEHRFRSANMALGILDEHEFDANVETIALADEGHLVCCSDGVIEQENTQREAFGRPRLEQLLESEAEGVIDRVVTELELHAKGMEFNDDVSVCSLVPAAVFAHLQHEADIDPDTVEEQRGEFSWDLRISGVHLANCDLPLLCNQFLQDIGFSQKKCQRVFAIVSEMVSNSLDHGILCLSSGLKEQEDGFSRYFTEREKRLANLTDANFIELQLQWQVNENGGELHICCCDSGQGYEFNCETNKFNLEYSGRGLALIDHLSVAYEVIPPGNIIKAVL